MIQPLVVFLVMIMVFLAGTVRFAWPAGLATAAAATAGIIAGLGRLDFPLLVEGAFGFFDVGIVIATAMFFMKALELAGILEALTTRLLGVLGSRRWLILSASMFMVMLPGMLTGSSTAAVLTTGRFVIPVLLSLGMSPTAAAAFVAVGSTAGMIAPPVNIPAMIIGSGVDMPYVGFEIPLLWISVPFALAMVMAFGLRLPARAKTVPPFSGAAAARENTGNRSLLPMLIPFAVILVPMLAIRIWPGKAPDPGLAFIFVLGALSVWAINTKLSVRDVARDSLDLSLPILGILAGAGMFVSAMTATGARGLMASSALLLPGTWLLLAAMCIIPLFGAISAYASASVLGVPFLLAFIGKGDIAVAAAISAMAAVGDLMPPIALVPSLSLNVFEQPPPRGKVIRLGLLAAVFLVLLAAGLIYKVRYL